MEKENEGAKTPAIYKICHVFGTVLGAFLFELFLILCLRYFEEWPSALWWTVFSLSSALNAALLTVDLVFYFLKKQVVYKCCIIAYILFVFLAVGMYVLLRTGFMEVMRDEGSFQAYIERAGGWMTALFILLQFLQVVILPIPSTVTVVAGAALFRPFWGSVYSLIGIVLGSLAAFLIGRYAGTKVVSWLVGKETLDKWLKKIKGKDKLLLTAMFLLPVFPDDILCFVAGFSSMSIWYFLTVIFISRVLAIFTTSYSVTLIPFNTWWGILIWAVLIALVIVLFVFLYKKSDAIPGWFEKKFRRETKIKEKKEKGDFTLEVVGPDGSVISKGVKRDEKAEEKREGDRK